MKTFTIDGNNRILVFASKKEAAASSTDAVTNQDEFAELTAEWPMQRLVGIWNGPSGVTPISKFTSRKIAVERLWKAIQGREVPANPELTVPETTMEPAVPAEIAPEPDVATVEPQEAPAQPELPAVEPQSPATVEEPQAVPEPPAQAAEDVAAVGAQAPDVAPAAEGPTQEPTPAKKARTTSRKATTQKQDSGPREGSKTAQVVAMLQRELAAL